MKNFIFEFDYDVIGFESEEEALKEAEYHWSRMDTFEKRHLTYFRVYEIDRDLNKLKYDPLDYFVRDIKNYL